MDEQYILDLFNQLGGESKFGKFDDFKELITTDNSYQQDFYNAFGANTLGDFDDFKSLVSASQQPATQPTVQPTVKKKDDMESSWWSGDGISESEPPTTKDMFTAYSKQLFEPAKPKEKPVEPYDPNKFMEGIAEPVVYQKAKVPFRDIEGGYADVQNRLSTIDKQIAESNPVMASVLKMEKSALLEKQKEIESSPVKEDGIPVDITAPKFIEDNLNALTPKQMAQYGPKGAKEVLDYYFKDAGFKFETDMYNINAISPNGEILSFSTLYPSKKNIDDLKTFIRTSAYKNPQIADKAYLYESENKKFRTKEEIDNEVKTVSDREEQFNNDYKSMLNLQKDIEQLRLDLKRYQDFGEQNTPKYIQTEAYLREREKELEGYVATMQNKEIDLKTQGEQLNKAVGKYTEFQATQGDFGGNLYRSIANISSGIFSNYLRLAVTKSVDFMPLSSVMGEEAYQAALYKKLKEKGYEGDVVPIDVLKEAEAEIGAKARDDFKKAAITGKYQGEQLNNVLTVNGVRESLSEFMNQPITSTKEYLQERQEKGSFIERGLYGFAGSLPAMIGDKYLRYMNMFMMTTDGALQEMDNNPNFADVSENEKELVALPIGVVGAVLEEFGLKNLKLGKSITSNILKTVLGRVPANATASTIRKTTFDVLAERGIRAGTTYAGGILSEMETGLLQQANDYAVKDIYSAMKEKKMFDNPAFLTSQYLYDLWDASRTEGVGAGVMSVPYSIAAAFQKDGFQALDDATFKIFEDLAKDNDSRKFFVTSLKNKINQGEVTPNQGKQMLDAYDQASGMISQVPDEIVDTESRKIAMDMLSERKKLEAKKEGKDAALAKPIQDKINQINEQLAKITEDAIQKQTAGEVYVQPETGAGQEMEVGGPEAKPQITPEESKRKEDLIAALEATDKDIITIGDEMLDRKEAQAELEAITQKEQAPITEQAGMEQAEGLGTQLETLAKEEPIVTESVPVTEEVVEKTPEQEADLLEELLTGKKKEPVAVEPTVTETVVEEEAKAEIPKAEEVAETDIEIKDTQTTPEEVQQQIEAFDEEALPEEEKPKPGTVAELAIEDINADPERFQYKEVTDKEAGVTEQFKGKMPFRKELAGVISVWVDPADGKTYVINGHHRLEFARRSGEKTMNVIYIDAKNASEARLKGAMQNIAEGMGTDMDAAKVFRETGMTVEQVQESGINVKGAKAMNGLSLASLSDNLFNLVMQGKLSQTVGVIIGSTIKNKDVQEQFYNVIKGKNLNNATIKVMAEDIQAAPTENVEQMDLFGVSATEQAAYQQRASFIAGIRSIVSKAKNILGKAAKSKVFLEEYGNEIDVATTETGSRESAMALAVFDKLRNTSPEIRALIDKGVERIKNGENKNKVLNETAKQIIEATPRILEGVTGQPVAGRGEVKEPGTKGKQGAKGKKSKFIDEKGRVNVEEILKTLSDKFSIPFEIINDPDQNYSGKFEDGRVYINMAYVTAETPWHEFAHPFIEQVKDDNIILYENLKKEIANTEYGQQVLKEVQKHYPELSIDEQFEEAIVETIARFATGKIDLETMQKNFSLFEKVIRFIEKIKEFIAKAINKEYAKNNNLKSGTLRPDDINLIQKSGLSFKRKIDNENYTLKDFAQMMQYSYRINLREYDRLETTKVKEEQTEILKNLTTDENKVINKFQELLRVLSKLTLQNYSIESEKNYKGLTNVMKFAYGAYVFVNNKGATMNDIVIGLKQKYPQMFPKEIFDPLNNILTEMFSQTPDGSIVDLVTDGVVDNQKLEQYVKVFDYTKIDSFNERIVENSSKALSLIENSLWKIEQKKQIQFKNQWTVSDFGGVYHNIGAYMNNAGISTIVDAINNFITLLSSGNRIELATYSAKSDTDILRGTVKIGFKPNTPVIYSYLQDVASYLVDTKKGKKRITDQKQNMRSDLEEELNYNYDELFLNATKDNIENLEILKPITDKEFDTLKQLSELTGAPIIQNNQTIYEPSTKREYKPESVKYSKFTPSSLADAIVKNLTIKAGGLQSNILGIPIAIWNSGVKTMAAAVRAGAAINEAVQKAIEHIRENHGKKFNEAAAEKKLLIGHYKGAIEVAREAKVTNEGLKAYFKRQGLTDTQIEALLTFKEKAEKKPISKEKVIGKPKPKKVTVNEMTALKDQIRLEARAAREAKGDLNAKRKMLAAAINDLAKKGEISVRQAKAIVNRISSVNLDNPVMVERLLTYAENIFNDADYDTRIQEVRKLQDKVKKVNHVSMKDTVREFASINPERIPADRLLEYIQALDDMSTRTPFYQKMNDMFDEVMSYKSESKEFDAIKTFQALIDKLESIAINQVKSVEDYVALIRDINSFKRKAYQLLQNGNITQEQYDQAIENVGKDQAAVEKKYEKELAALKEKLVQEINGLKPEVHPDFTPEEAALINKYLELSDADLETLSPEELYILNDLLNNIKEDVQLDYYRLSEIVSKAYTNIGGKKLSEQIEKSKFNKSSDEGKKLLLEYESAFWEGLLGLGRVTSGALQKFIVSPFNRAIASYENTMKDGYFEFAKLKKKYNMKDYNMNRIGMFTTYLQEYMAQFDSSNKDVKDIGTRDWFGEIISNDKMRDGYKSAKPSAKRLVGLGDTELKTIEKIYNSLPKDANGKVDPKAVYDSFMANDGKFFTKKEKAFFDKIMDWKQKNLASKQKAANEMNGMGFKEIPFHMMRVRLDRGAKQISPSAEGSSGVVRIEAGTGKERASQKVGPIMTNFEQLFSENLEQTARNYYLQEAINDINNTLSVAKKELKGKKVGLLNSISGTISEALNFEFDKTESQFLSKNLLAARAAETLFSPIRTAVELTSTFLSYPFRAKTAQGYKELFGKQGQMKNLLEFTSSPLRLRENINKAIDISDGRIKPKGKFEKAINYLSGLPERTMMVTSWMPTFNNEFKDITGVRFDMDKFNSDAAYRQKYGKAIKEAAAVADAQTEKIIGSTTKAGGRRQIRIAPKILANVFGSEGTVKKNTTAGQILGFFSNYPYREMTEFLNGFKEAAEVYRNKGGALKSISQMQKPLGITINLATYGFLSSVVYAMKLMLLGDDEDEKKGEATLKELMTLKGFMEELQGNAISLAASKYAAGGKAMLQFGATVAYNATSDKEQKAKIKKLLKNSVFVEPIDAEKVQAYGGRNEVLGAISSYVPQFVLFAKRIEESVQTAGELKVIYDKFQEGGLSALSEDDGIKILAIDAMLKSVQLGANLTGTSLPMYNDIKMYMKGAKKEAGVGDIKLSPTENKHKEALQGYKNEKEFKENDPEGYLEAIDEGGSIYKYKEEQRKKQEEKDKDKPFRGMSEEAFKKKYPDEWRENYGPGTDYYYEQRTPEARAKKREEEKLELEIKKIKKQNKEK